MHLKSAPRCFQVNSYNILLQQIQQIICIIRFEYYLISKNCVHFSFHFHFYSVGTLLTKKGVIVIWVTFFSSFLSELYFRKWVTSIIDTLSNTKPLTIQQKHFYADDCEQINSLYQYRKSNYEGRRSRLHGIFTIIMRLFAMIDVV